MKGALSKKDNSFYNQIWAQHARPWGKKHGSRKRRKLIKQQLKTELNAL